MFGDTGKTANAGFWLEYLQEQGVKTVKRTKEVMQKALAFTLVELLVVISILGLLAGLSIPAISAARASAQTAASITNLKQIYTMMQIYLAENNNTYPASLRDQADGTKSSWRRSIYEAANGSLWPNGDYPSLTNNLAKGPYAKVMWCPLMVAKYSMDSSHEWGRGSYSINQFFNQARNSLGLGVDGDFAGKNEPFVVAGGAERLIGTAEEFISTAAPNKRGRDGAAYQYGATRNKALVMFLNGQVELIESFRGNQIDGDVGNRNNLK
jgi:prepilin-type N-terminal cleavage/methylation domain-containing protein